MYMCCQSFSISNGLFPMTLPARSRMRSGQPPSAMPVTPISVSTVTSSALWLNDRFMLGCAQHFTRVILAFGSAAADCRTENSVAPTPAASDLRSDLRSIMVSPFASRRGRRERYNTDFCSLPHVPAARGQVVEADQVDIVAAAVFRGLKQVFHAAETRLARQIIGDVRDTNRDDRIHHDLALVHGVTAAHLDVWPLPDADTASNPPASNAVAKAFGEQHEERSQATLPALRLAFPSRVAYRLRRS